MDENCLCAVIDEDERVLCVRDETCCEEIRENLEPYECL
jgi:Flp pilus assembly CpaF family ATPase